MDSWLGLGGGSVCRFDLTATLGGWAACGVLVSGWRFVWLWPGLRVSCGLWWCFEFVGLTWFLVA